MNETEIKTRQGLILESVLAAALTKAGFTFDHDVQYDETCEKPDFLIPNKSKPKIMVEAHQTEARNSFQMKTLRAFTAVTESKAHFGNGLVSVNVLFGDPDNELPASNVKAMCGIFDVNIIPRRDSGNPALIQKMEAFALSLARDEGKTTEAAGKEVVKEQAPAVAELAKLIKSKITGAKARAELDRLWNLERARAKKLGTAPVAGDATYYKRCMLWSLFLNDQDFAELQSKKDPAMCSASVQKQLLATKLATVREEIDGDYYDLNPQFADFLDDPECLKLRGICKTVLDTVPAMKWFFEDIRDQVRRVRMAKSFLRIAGKDEASFRDSIRQCFENGTWDGVKHTRCWLADLMAAVVDKPHNLFNSRMRASPRYTMTLGNPFNNVVIRSDRLGSDQSHLELYWSIACDVYFELLREVAVDPKSVSPDSLADALLELRVGAAIKLRKLDPLFLVVVGLANSLGLSISQDPVSIKGVISDLSNSRSVGQFKLRLISRGTPQKSVIINAVAVHDNNGDHKSKEWGARRLATLYRMGAGKFRTSEYEEGIFLLDGEWADKDVARLHRSGWNHVVRLTDLEKTLCSVFGITKKKGSPTVTVIPMPEADDDLPLAAEDE